jgi:hypothetical protein
MEPPPRQPPGPAARGPAAPVLRMRESCAGDMKPCQWDASQSLAWGRWVFGMAQGGWVRSLQAGARSSRDGHACEQAPSGERAQRLIQSRPIPGQSGRSPGPGRTLGW